MGKSLNVTKREMNADIGTDIDVGTDHKEGRPRWASLFVSFF